MAQFKYREYIQSDEKLYPDISDIATDSDLYPRLSKDESEHSPPVLRRSKRLLKHPDEHSPKDSTENQCRREKFQQNRNIRTNIHTGCLPSRESDIKLKRSSTKNGAAPHKENMWNIGLIIFAFTLVIFILVILMYTSEGNQRENVRKINFDYLRSKFKTQSNRVWNILKASTSHIIAAEEPDRPAVIMMILPNTESHLMALCLAQHLSHDINQILKGKFIPAISYPFINATNFINYETSDQKLKLDNSIQDIIKQRKSVIITHLEKFHSETVMYFHGLCDTTEAMHKRIAVIFLLETSYQLRNERELSLYLENLWSDIDRIRIKPLLSRVANNVVFLNQDKGFTNCL